MTQAMTAHHSSLSLMWLVRLRWITAVGQAFAILVSARMLPDELPVLALLGLVLLGALSNGALWLRLRRPEPVQAWLPGLVLGLDILLLTGLLYGSGGPANPFTAVYLVHITLAAVVMRGAWAWGLGLLAMAGFGLLFVSSVHIHSLGHMSHGDGDGMRLHLTGMWVAFALTATLIAAFVGRVTEALRQREVELAALRDLSARQARLAALTTLAAGVAHELGTPLGTIAVASKELQRSAEGMGPEGLAVAQDAALIRQEVNRCRRILDQMAGPSTSLLGEAFVPLDWQEFQASLLEGLSDVNQARVVFEWPDVACGAVPRRGLARAVRAVLTNALEATPRPGFVKVSAKLEHGFWHLEVIDFGSGMAPAVLARVGEPFFSTKPTGSGMGLGLFLARTFAEQLGGELRVASTPGQGTKVHLTWPEVLHA